MHNEDAVPHHVHMKLPPKEATSAKPRLKVTEGCRDFDDLIDFGLLTVHSGLSVVVPAIKELDGASPPSYAITHYCPSCGVPVRATVEKWED